MERNLKPSRLMFLAVLLTALIIITVFVLIDLTTVQAEAYLSQPGTASIASTVSIQASRGAILDRNGTLLAEDKAVYNVNISRAQLLKEESPNDTVLSLVRSALSHGESYVDTFPVTLSAPFEFVVSQTGVQRSRLASYLEYFRLDEDISAPELISWMREHYGISFTVTAEDARRIIGVRYELEIRAIVSTTDYIFASHVSNDFVTWVLTSRMASVSVDTTYERVYYNDCAKHIIGTVGPIYAEEYKEKKDQGYSMNSIIGKTGVESAFEEYLRGRTGSVTTYTDRSGAIVDRVVNSQPVAGGNVYLTIDLDLNRLTEESLASVITSINESRKAEALETGETVELAEGGAAVVLDVRTAEVLAMASYPEYSVSSWNRATQGTYEPGSTYKMVTALAGLSYGYITPQTEVRDEGRYMRYAEANFTPGCWVYPRSHGMVNVHKAIQESCNYFFYWLSDQMGIDPIADFGRQFGLGSPTGIELGEQTGILASRETKRQYMNDGWYSADTIMASIGQSINQFTPIQMANYVATIANGGTHYRTTILSYVTSANYSDILVEHAPEVLNVIDDEHGYFGLIQKAMRAVVTDGTARGNFVDLAVPIAAKTGTVQSDNAAMNTGVFVCYAPADDPQIAIAVVVEKGGSGSGLTQVARDILAYYFTDNSVTETVGGENALQP